MLSNCEVTALPIMSFSVVTKSSCSEGGTFDCCSGDAITSVRSVVRDDVSVPAVFRKRKGWNGEKLFLMEEDQCRCC